MHSITDWLQHASAPMVYAVVGALVFCEDALFFGFVLPGETAVVLGGVVASQGHVSVYWLCVVVVLAAVLGDSVGYEVGARFGPRILEIRFLRKHRDRIGSAQELIRRRGPVAVFLGRFIAFFRALMPALAGISHMPYRVFLVFNAAGGLVWGVGFTLLGYFAGTAYKQVERTAGTAVAIAVAGIVVVALIVWEVRRHRRGEGKQGRGRKPGEAGESGSAEEHGGHAPSGGAHEASVDRSGGYEAARESHARHQPDGNGDGNGNGPAVPEEQQRRPG
ncbi:DedA family protein [Actinacidiphila acidipaludis]|uniref:DedA family protein n=1 Tax=Actinacidiphila acidipaludis TaxID=2873382 RepID=A0ABS7Q849_9ACTN|nr:DedA family protein [Streptomyces acidipaludis]MBY8879325.1 DedA family protein [Streptomyces acidipaludis]